MDASIDHNKQNLKLKKSSNLPPPVRIVGNIRDFTTQESAPPDSKPWIVVSKSTQSNLSQGVTISFSEHSTSRKDTFELDYCYEQNEGNSVIYSEELKPLIPELINGRNLTVIAYGARGSGKTYTMKGTEENPGLAIMTMAEILSKAEEINHSVSISMYEVYHEHVIDLLDANHTEVQVLEDAQGRINLKGLSKVLVRSMKEFSNLFSGWNSFQKKGHRNPLEPMRRCHKGLIVYISSCDNDNNFKVASKLNFVDLAGYEDSRRNNEEGLQITKINKSLHGLFNVIHATNANEMRVPYRENKLTRVLKESLNRNNHILMVTCLNPSFCQDTIHSVSLASRSCQRKTLMLRDSKKRIESASKLESVSSSRRDIRVSSTRRESSVSSARRDIRVSSTRRESSVSLARRESSVSSARRESSVSLARKEKSVITTLYTKKEIGSNHKNASNKGSSVSKERRIHSDIKTMKLEKPKRKPLSSNINASVIISQEKLQTPDVIPISSSETLLDEEHVRSSEALLDEVLDEEHVRSSETLLDEEHDFHVNVDPAPFSSPEKGINKHTYVSPSGINSEKGKENISLQIIGNGSPPLSEQIKAISENLKALYAQSSLTMDESKELDAQVETRDYVEPRTPVIEHHVKVEDRYVTPINNNASRSFQQRSSGMKQSLVQEYLRFLNTASKEELKELKGIGEKRSTYILELRQNSHEPFKKLDDLEEIGLSAKQIKGMVKNMAGSLFN